MQKIMRAIPYNMNLIKSLMIHTHKNQLKKIQDKITAEINLTKIESYWMQQA